MEKPICQPCLRNQQAIYSVLNSRFTQPGSVLELASGTGQHAVYMATRMPHIKWYSTDIGHNLHGASLWIKDANLENLPAPIALDIASNNWPIEYADYGFASNIMHYVSAENIAQLFTGLSQTLPKNGLFICYGPFNNNGFTSEGNAALHEWLQTEVNKEAGIKELSEVEAMAHEAGFQLNENISMPANNHILVFSKIRD